MIDYKIKFITRGVGFGEFEVMSANYQVESGVMLPKERTKEQEEMAKSFLRRQVKDMVAQDLFGQNLEELEGELKDVVLSAISAYRGLLRDEPRKLELLDIAARKLLGGDEE